MPLCTTARKLGLDLQGIVERRARSHTKSDFFSEISIFRASFGMYYVNFNTRIQWFVYITVNYN